MLRKFNHNSVVAVAEIGVAAAVANAAYALQYVPEAMRDDEDIMMVAVTKRWNALEWASDRLKNQKELVLVAIAQSPHGWHALKYASDALKGDLDVVKAAMGKSAEASQYMNVGELKQVKELRHLFSEEGEV